MKISLAVSDAPFYNVCAAKPFIKMDQTVFRRTTKNVVIGEPKNSPYSVCSCPKIVIVDKCMNLYAFVIF